MLEQRLVAFRKIKRSRSAAKFGRFFVPFGGITHDVGPVERKLTKVDFRWRQDARPFGCGDQRQIEFAAVDELLGKAGLADLPRPRLDLIANGASVAFRDDGMIIEAE